MMTRSRARVVRVLGPALALSVGGSMLVPDDSGLLGEGTGGGGSGQVRIENPITDLRRDLVQGPDVPLVFVRTQDPDPTYLRISALDSFDGTTWRPSVRDLPPSQRLEGELPAPVGLGDDAEGVRYRYELSAFEAFDSEWLPLPFPAVAAEALGDWRYDAETRDVTTVDGDLTTADLDYSATRLRSTPTARDLLESFSPPVSITQANTDLPFEGDEVPAWLQDLVDEVTEGARTDFERAVAIQRWFRDPANFTYSTDREAGNGIDDLRTFLTPGPDGRVGYCEQFASAMAVMARVAGIPTRVAVGFLRPDAVGPGTWLYSAHDLHSWPEVFFAGSGWVRFEPTPAQQAPDVPGYTSGALPQLDQTEGPSPTAAPSSAATSTQPEEDVTTAATRATPRARPHPGGGGSRCSWCCSCWCCWRPAPCALGSVTSAPTSQPVAGTRPWRRPGPRCARSCWTSATAGRSEPPCARSSASWPRCWPALRWPREATTPRPPSPPRRCWPTWTHWCARSSGPASPPGRCPGRIRTRPGDAPSDRRRAVGAHRDQ